MAIGAVLGSLELGRKALAKVTEHKPELVAGLHEAQDSFRKAVSAPASVWNAHKPQGDRFFSHAPRNPQDLTAAQSWKPGQSGLSGSEANAQINADYSRLGKDMQRYQAGDPNGPKLPRLADWMQFGKYASREAGEQIRNLEDMAKAETGDPKAAADLARNGCNTRQIVQSLMMEGCSVREKINAGTFGKALLSPIGTLAQLGVEGTSQLLDRLGKLQSALVKGNTEIHQNIAPAYDAFLTGESNGQGGMKSLERAGYSAGSAKDPQGFLTSAFANYQKARQLGLEAQHTQDPAQREKLLAERRSLTEDANLKMGLQEQMEILQKKEIFGDPDVQKGLGSVSGLMSVSDANGVHNVGAADKNWTDFAGRMGFRSVNPEATGAIQVRDLDGQVNYYKIDPRQTGTISEYFTQNVAGPAAENLIDGEPRPLVQEPESKTGYALDLVARKMQQAQSYVGGCLDYVN